MGYVKSSTHHESHVELFESRCREGERARERERESGLVKSRVSRMVI